MINWIIEVIIGNYANIARYFVALGWINLILGIELLIFAATAGFAVASTPDAQYECRRVRILLTLALVGWETIAAIASAMAIATLSGFRWPGITAWHAAVLGVAVAVLAVGSVKMTQRSNVVL